MNGNNALLRIVGYAREEMLAGKVRWRDITPLEYHSLDNLALEQIERAGRCASYDKEFLRKDGTRVPVLLGAAWLSGQGMGVAYFLDITDRKRHEEAMRRQTRILRSILDSIGDGVVVADEEGKFVLFNPAAEQILRLGITDARPENWPAQLQHLSSGRRDALPGWGTAACSGCAQRRENRSGGDVHQSRTDPGRTLDQRDGATDVR